MDHKIRFTKHLSPTIVGDVYILHTGAAGYMHTKFSELSFEEFKADIASHHKDQADEIMALEKSDAIDRSNVDANDQYFLRF